MEFSRRDFLKIAGVSGATLALGTEGLALQGLKPVEVPNPLEAYPARDWEKVYRDQYRYERTFTYVCSPNDTHHCRMRAFVRNGIVMRVEQNYDVDKYSDLYGNKSTPIWHPRGCAKGMSVHRRVYGPYRLKYPTVRKGWKQWADDGFPYLDAANKRKYKFDSRGTDTFVRVSWDDVYTYIAKAVVAVSKRYSGEEGARLLKEQGYEPEMIEAMHGSGTMTCKFRGGMGLLGVTGKYGLYRWANSLALLDASIRGVPPADAHGGRAWSNYTWHGDQAPGQPYVHGLQASDSDFNESRHAKLHIQCGKNLVENKMPESHFFIELIERGAKIVSIAPEYNPPATKADYWIPVRPGVSDTALFLGITKILMDKGWYDEDYIKKFTDFPLLVRTDNLKRLKANEVFPNYKPGLDPNGPSFKKQNLKPDQYEKLGDYVVFDRKSQSLKPITRDDVGDKMTQKGLDPELNYRGRVKLADGSEVEVMTLWEAYKVHLRDYDLNTVHEITHAPKELIERLARDIWETTLEVRKHDPNKGAVAIHIGEGINHWFHATLANRSMYLPLMLTGNVGKMGSGCHTWAGNYKAALFQGSPWTGPGFVGWVAEDPFNMNLDKNAHGKDIKPKKYFKDEEPAYWNRGDRPLTVNTPKYGHKCFTGHSHMPSPTKFLWFCNVNLFNNAKHAYDMLFNVNPNIECIISQDVEMTSSCEYADIVLPANFWLEFQTYEITASCSNPFLQLWKGGIKPSYDSKDDSIILAEAAAKMSEVTGDKRFADYWRFILDDNENGVKVYLQRLMDSCITTVGYKVDDILSGKFGEPGAALMLFRTYPREPFYEQIHDSEPFFTDTGRLNSYCDIPEAIEYGENFIVHREGPEATMYLPNVIVSSNPLIRPDNYGITPAMLQGDVLDADLRTIANNKLPWAQVKQTKNPLWEKGYHFYCLTPKTRHRVHSQWSVCDWTLIWDSNFGDPYRMDKRTPGVGEHQMHINPQTAKEMGINDGDYIYVDANPADRPYRGWKPDDPRYKVARLMLRVKYNPAYPKNVVMMKHAPFIATEKTVKAHETRPDGRAVSEDTGYQSNFRYGSQQSLTRDWSMPMHQTDTLFHKAKVMVGFIFGGEADNHAVNTVPKETLVRITKAEPGGMGGKGIWEPARTGYTPGRESEFMKKYLSGKLVEVKKE